MTPIVSLCQLGTQHAVNDDFKSHLLNVHFAVALKILFCSIDKITKTVCLC